jgi:hypothetical protein
VKSKGPNMTTSKPSQSIDPGVRIGHVQLKVADLERSLRFYCGVLGFELTQRYGTQSAFVSVGSVSEGKSRISIPRRRGSSARCPWKLTVASLPGEQSPRNAVWNTVTA